MVNIAKTLSPSSHVIPPREELGNRAWPIGWSFGSIYVFKKAGDVIKEHIHEPDSGRGHASIVLKGSVEYMEADVSRVVRYEDFEVIDCPNGVPHGFRSLEDDCLLLNMRKPRTDA